jgi:glycosyltransferase involved in cell wall biosynthesis
MSTKEQLKILFLSRRYPPSVGGIQTHCFNLFNRLQSNHTIKLIALGNQSLLHLAWFVPYTFLASFIHILFNRVDVVYFSDGVICCLAPFLRPFTRARFVVTVYGLEMTYATPIFSSLMRWGVSVCEKVPVISEKTREVSIAAEVPSDKIDIIYLGIDPPTVSDERREELKKQFERDHGIKLGEDKVLINFGRQVPRKGIANFLERGMPLLDADIKFIVSGSGPDSERIRQVRDEQGLQERVLLEWLDNDVLAMLRGEADLFLMPNIPYPNDVEGFGIAQLECMHDGTPAIVFAVDALVESVRRGGYCIPANDYQAFADQIHAFYKLSPEHRAAIEQEAKEYVRTEYTWDKTAEQYIQVFKGEQIS